MYKKLVVILAIISIAFVPNLVKALEVSPVRQAVSIEPGEDQVVRITVKNDSDSRSRFKPSVDSFRTTKEGIIEHDDQDKAVDWVEYNRDPFFLNPGEAKTLTYEIKVPENVDSKSHYLTLFVGKVSDTQDITVSSRVGSLLFVHVAGTVKESLVLGGFSFRESIYFGDDPKLDLLLKNEGSIHLKPSGQITLSNQFDKIIKQKQVKGQLVLPDDLYERKFSFADLDWRDAGKITANVYLQYGRSSLPLSAKTSFWYVPKKLVYVTVGFTLIITAFLLILGNKKRNENRPS